MQTKAEMLNEIAGPLPPPLGPMRVYHPKAGMAWNPLRTLGPNTPCFCGSKKKFKKCCRLTVSECVSEANATKLAEFITARRSFPDLTIKFTTVPADPGDLPGTVQHVPDAGV